MPATDSRIMTKKLSRRSIAQIRRHFPYARERKKERKKERERERERTCVWMREREAKKVCAELYCC